MLRVPVEDDVPLLLVLGEPLVVTLELPVFELVILLEAVPEVVPDLLLVVVPDDVIVAQFVHEEKEDEVSLLVRKGVAVSRELPLPLLETVLVPVVDREAVVVLLEEPLLVELPDDVADFEAEDDVDELLV